MNQFLNKIQQRDTLTENGALSNSTTQSAILDYFAKCGTYRNRSMEEISADYSRMWAENPELALRAMFYVRMVSRNTKVFGITTEKTQKGQGCKDEFRKALMWLWKNHPETYIKNMRLVPVVGKWNDLWHPDVVEALPAELTYELIMVRAVSGDAPLIAKYLPRIRSKKKVTLPRHISLNKWTKGFCKYAKISQKTYRQWKSDPQKQAHQFQRDMCANRWSALNFDKIPGRALSRFVDGNILSRHNQEERFLEWLDTQPTAKFTGYVYELAKGLGARSSIVKRRTADKQFEGLLELARDNSTRENVWCALDTSGSMEAEAVAGVSAYDVCISLGIYFSSLNEGHFKDHVVMFDNVSRILKLGGSFSEKLNQIRSASTAWGSTSFQSVIDEIVRVRTENPNIPIEDFPSTILVVSDMQFNDTETAETNYEAAMRKLHAVGLPDVKIIWWCCVSRGKDFPSTINDKGVTMIGGFDGSVVDILLGHTASEGPEKALKAEEKALDAYQQMIKVLEQEVLNYLEP